MNKDPTYAQVPLSDWRFIGVGGEVRPVERPAFSDGFDLLSTYQDCAWKQGHLLRPYQLVHLQKYAKNAEEVQAALAHSRTKQHDR